MSLIEQRKKVSVCKEGLKGGDWVALIWPHGWIQVTICHRKTGWQRCCLTLQHRRSERLSRRFPVCCFRRARLLPSPRFSLFLMWGSLLMASVSILLWGPKIKMSFSAGSPLQRWQMFALCNTFTGPSTPPPCKSVWREAMHSFHVLGKVVSFYVVFCLLSSRMLQGCLSLLPWVASFSRPLNMTRVKVRQQTDQQSSLDCSVWKALHLYLRVLWDDLGSLSWTLE